MVESESETGAAASSRHNRVRRGSAPIWWTARASIGPAAWITERCFLALVSAV